MSIHETLDREHEVKTSSDRSFGFVFAAFFAIIGGWPLVGGAAPRWWALALALAFLVVAVVAPRILAPLNRAWGRVGALMHRIVNPVITGLVFYAAVTPTGLLMRAFGKDPLRLRWDPQAKSYWIERKPPGPPPDSMSHQF